MCWRISVRSRVLRAAKTVDIFHKQLIMKHLIYLLTFIGCIWSCTTPGTPPTDCPPCPTDTLVTNPPATDTGLAFLIGSNGNHYHPKAKQTKVQGIRLYFPIGWGVTENGWYGDPLKQAQKQFLGLDEYLQYMKDNGTDVLLCLMQSPDWLNGQTQGVGVNDYPPIRPGLDRSKSESYREIAGIYGMFTKRYGSKAHAPGSYKIDPAGPRWNGDKPQLHKSALKLVTHIEVGNELDRWWDKGTPKYMTPEEHAAFLLACYDSIKAADPKMRVVMAGLTNFDKPYLVAMNNWFLAHGRQFAADVLEVHHYSSYGNLPGVHPPTWRVNEAAPPELDKDFATVVDIVAFGKSIGKKVWIGEYGYDTQPGSQMYPTPFAGFTSEQIQAQWLVRAALEYIRLGAERTYLYNLADEYNPNGGTFTSSGLLYGEPRGYADKPSMEAMANLCENLKGARYFPSVSTSDQVRQMEFRRNGLRIIYFWSPTAQGKTLNYPVANGPLITVTETPQFITIKTTQNAIY